VKEMGIPRKEEWDKIEKLAAQHGWEKFPGAIEEWIRARSGIDGLRQRWPMFFKENSDCDFFARVANAENEESRLQGIRDRSELHAVFENCFMMGLRSHHIAQGFAVSPEERTVLESVSALDSNKPFFGFALSAATLRSYIEMHSRFFKWKTAKEEAAESDASLEEFLNTP
jgi:hypothetical protein